jgi:hypothetical protein
MLHLGELTTIQQLVRYIYNSRCLLIFGCNHIAVLSLIVLIVILVLFILLILIGNMLTIVRRDWVLILIIVLLLWLIARVALKCIRLLLLLL